MVAGITSGFFTAPSLLRRSDLFRMTGERENRFWETARLLMQKSHNLSDHAAGTRVAIVGGGPAGSLLALALAQRGYCVDVYERRSDPRKQITGRGKSINLGLSKRGMQALHMVGLLDRVLQRAVTMRGRVIHSIDGTARFQPYGNNTAELLHSVDRNELNHLLLEDPGAYQQVVLHLQLRLVAA